VGTSDAGGMVVFGEKCQLFAAIPADEVGAEEFPVREPLVEARVVCSGFRDLSVVPCRLSVVAY
jgi:hypothetical protein